MQPDQEGRTTEKETRSITLLVSNFVQNLTALMRKDLQIAKIELSDTLYRAGLGAGLVIAGGVLGFAGLLVLLDFLVFGIATFLEPQAGGYPWLSALIVGLVVTLIAGMLAFKGFNILKAESQALRRLAESLQRAKH